MIKKLRKRFILAAMLSMFIVLFLLVSAINVLNYRHLVSEADQMVSQIYTHRDDELMLGGKPYEARFFWVKFDSNQETLSVNTSQIRDVDEDQAVSMASQVLSNTSGFSGIYRYHVYTSSSENLWVIFVNCEHQIDIFQSFLVSSIGVSAFAFLAIMILIVVTSRFGFKGVLENDLRQKQLITNAGHELKTPLAIIQANADMIELEFGENEWTKGIEAQVKRMTSLTNDLMMLARTEEGVSMVMQTFDLSAVYTDMAMSFEGLAKSRDMQLEYTIEPDILFYGNQKYLSELLSIFLENALKYASAKACITLRLYRKASRIYLSVINPTDQDLSGDLNQWFDRFYRQNGKGGKTGYGLGLAIAKAICQAHQGDIKILKVAEKTVEMRVSLPYRKEK